MVTQRSVCLEINNYIILEFQGPTGPETLAPARGFLASLERMFVKKYSGSNPA